MNESFWSTVGSIAPFASAEALSYTPVVGALVLLLGDRGRRAAVIYLVGWLTALAVVATTFVVGGRALMPRVRIHGPVVGVVEIVVGLALVVVGVVAWRGRAISGRTIDRLLDRLEEAHGPALFLAGLLLGLGPKSLLLGLSAGVVVRQASLPLAEVVLAVVAYVVLAGWTVALPVVASFVVPKAANRWFEAVEGWLTRHGSLVTAIVLAVVGVVVVVDGIGRY